MNTGKKSTGIALVVPGLLLQVGCMMARNIAGVTPGAVQFLQIGSLVGLLLLIMGLRRYANSKGYSGVFGLLGFFSFLGVLFVAVLPDKTKPVVSTGE